MVGAQADGMDNATITTRNFPNPLAGARVAAKRPPMLVPPANPVSHAGIEGALAANAAPSMWTVIWKNDWTAAILWRDCKTYTGDEDAKVCVREYPEANRWMRIN